MAGLGALLLPGFSAQAQCTLQPSGLVSFEPKPPGAQRPTYLSSGFNSNLALYRNGGSGPYRLLMQESFGYSVLDLSNPTNPNALYYHDVRFPINGANSVTQHGDGQNIIQTVAVSPDGQRVAFATTGPAAPFQTIVGSPDGANGFTLWGDFFPDRAAGTLVQHIGARYIAYDIHSSLATASDITTLPSSVLAPNNMGHELTTWPGGYLASLAGSYILYMAGGAIQVIDASRPGPAGSITAGFPLTTITSADFGGRTIAYYSAAVDPADATKLWVLVELNALPGLPPPAGHGENSPSYGLLSINSSLQKVSAGPIWRVPSQAGDVWWSNPGPSSSLIAGDGGLFVLMWAQRALPSLLFELYSTTAGAWGAVNSSVPPGKFDIPSSFYGNFSTGQPMRGFSTGGSMYAYLPTGTSAYVIPMTCASQNAPASASMTVADQAGAALNSGDTVFVGDQITITPSVSPSPAGQPLTGFGWNLDFDFHASEETGASPHIKANDNAAFGSGATPPTLVTVVGPCDFKVANTTFSGAGCWNSVTTNAAFGGPDFPAYPAAGTIAPLKFAFEANNSFGSVGLGTFMLNWKVPAARVQSTQILAGGALVSASDGHPAAYQWSFGPVGGPLGAPTCATPSCAPPSPYNTKGTYAYSLTAKYFVDQAFTATIAGTYTVTDFTPKFLVNGSSVDPITVTAGQPLTIMNQSSKGAGVTGAYLYSLCNIPVGQATCAAGAYAPFALQDAPSSTATIPAPAVGNWLLRIHVNYSNPAGQVDWTPNTGASDPLAFRLSVPDVIPEIHVLVNGLSPCVPVPGPGGAGTTCPANAFTANVGDPLTAVSWVNGYQELAPVNLAWDFGSPNAFPASGSGQSLAFSYSAPSPTGVPYTVKLTRNGSLPVSATVTVFPAVTVVASVSPAWVYPGSPAAFSCSASGGSGSFTYSWSFTGGAINSAQNPALAFAASGAASGTCVATDSQNTSSKTSASASLVVVPTVGSGPTSFFVISPCRLLDTRLVGQKIGPSGSADRIFSAVGGACGIPSSARSIVTNVSVTNVGATGDLAVFGGNDSPNGSTSISFKAGTTRANVNVIRLATDGSGTIKARNNSSAPLDLIVDVAGYYK